MKATNHPILRTATALLGGLVMVACGAAGSLPTIEAIDPNPAKPGDTITIYGLNFGNPAVAEGSTEFREGFGVMIGDAPMAFVQDQKETGIVGWNGDEGYIQVKLPGDLAQGSIDVVVSTDAGESKPFPLLVNASGTGGVVQPIIGWVLHDNAPVATLFQATAAGLISDPTSWTLTTDAFPATLAEDDTSTPVIRWDFNWGADWNVTLNDVSASLDAAVAYLSISATDVSNSVTYNFLRPFEGFAVENAAGDLPTGLGPVRLGDWGPVVALGIGDQTISHIDSAAGTVVAIDYLELIDDNFIALGIYGGVDEATELPYTMLVGNRKTEGTAKMLVLWQQPGATEGEAATPHVLTIENTDWVLNGLVASEGWHSWVVARKVSDCPAAVVYAECTGPDHVVTVQYRGNATEGTNFSDELVQFVGVVTMPEGIELRGITQSQGGLYLPYAARVSGEGSDGVYMLRTEMTQQLGVAFAALLADEQTVQIPVPGGAPALQAAPGEPGETATESLTLTYNSYPVASFDVTYPVAIYQNTYGTIQIKFDDVMHPSWNLDIYHFDISVSGGGALATYIAESFYYAAPNYYGHPNTNFSVETTTSVPLDVYDAPAYNEIYFFPVTDTVDPATITITAYSYDSSVSTSFAIDVVAFGAAATDVPAAADIKKTDGSAPVADPRDVYVIPNTPLVLVSSHGDNSVAVINSLLSPAHMHNFPSYGSGPTRLACGVVTPDAAK